MSSLYHSHDNYYPQERTQSPKLESSSSSDSIKTKRKRSEGDVPDQALQYATIDMVRSLQAQTPSGIPDNWRYRLEIVQEPMRARMCGFGEKPVDINNFDPGFFTICAVLYDYSSNKEASIVVHPPSSTNIGNMSQQLGMKNLVGNCLVDGKRLKDAEGELGIWFVYQDLSVRTDGIDPIPILATANSRPFTVYPPKRFPGMIEPSPLARCFSKQGIKIPARKENKKSEFSPEQES
ncbi:5716_t:CDS:2 [Diversispora eburnea]|uniref:5716_t:CDS:1 n=1 Tax=Diversispora eburnea TaxID=1213867 RepID=A0A9N9B875_9GLOM|nr:5716_t:CDS:2 [Diversispora eburnea]